MGFEGIDPRTIEFNKKLQVYRSCPQGLAEAGIFYHTRQSNNPCYAGNLNSRTFVTNDLFRGLNYGRDYGGLFLPERVPFPFTYYITLMAINILPYLDRLYRDTSGNEGIVISGPINLRDIEILFCADKNSLYNLDLASVVLSNGLSKENAEEEFQTRKQDFLFVIGESPDLTLVNRYRQNPKHLTGQIYKYMKRMLGDAHLDREEITKLLPRVVKMFSPR